MRVITLLSYGCPTQAIVHAYDLDERTVAEWQKRAGKHCEQVHYAIVEQGNVKSQHIQADEIRAKGRKLIIWMAFAMDVTTRLWMAGAVSTSRDRTLIDHLFQHVRACCQFVQGLLVCTDGFAAYPNSIMRAFRLISEETRRAWKMQPGGMGRSLYCNGYQTDREETCSRSNQETHQRNIDKSV
jgi:Transposase IS66 family.